MKVKVFDLDINQVCLLGLEGILRNGEYVGHLRRGDHAHYLDTWVFFGILLGSDFSNYAFLVLTWSAQGGWIWIRFPSRWREGDSVLAEGGQLPDWEQGPQIWGIFGHKISKNLAFHTTWLVTLLSMRSGGLSAVRDVPLRFPWTLSNNPLFQATLHMKTPFDSSNDRIQVTFEFISDKDPIQMETWHNFLSGPIRCN